MRPPRTLTITRVSQAGVDFRGPGARDLYIALTGRGPVYNVTTRSWVTQPSRVADLTALAEARGYVVEYRDQRELAADPGEGRW